jgi:hypothetical protein
MASIVSYAPPGAAPVDPGLSVGPRGRGVSVCGRGAGSLARCSPLLTKGEAGPVVRLCTVIQDEDDGVIRGEHVRA